ncbi:3-methyl-2-oxobutanoate hydroxymethyltransferase [Aliagarivorans taiwanensis]|uniref:3-methyl-2-oxobutanoate hydroxymethyltransferase n=1 Tax=Aliagarivorans taiwanensis TaxID=561966 RepID=UPI0004129F2D|nr:3-methyl-2-oxobutanoate hydroxymethyltransferase [Aliagarivorans taiwanensis]
MTRITAAQLKQMKQQGDKFSCITAYDASFAALFDQAGMHMLLIGDSMGMVLQGNDDTVAVTVEHVAYHTRSVANGSDKALIVADMPFMSYATTEQAYENAAKLMQAGAQMVKVEGGDWLTPTIRGLVERGIPVCGHLGLTPQSVHLFGGFKVQGREPEQADEMLKHAIELEAAGVQLLVLECIPTELAKRITNALQIPVIGIGAGNVTDGQILVMHDAFGITKGHIPKFSKNFLSETGDIRSAVSRYIEQVASGEFPAAEHSFN